MTRVARIALLGLLVLHGFVSYRVWQVQRTPDAAGSVVRAQPAVIQTHVDSAVRSGLAALSDGSLPAATRFANYKTELRRARELLVRSLDANPVQPNALATLATLDYELDPANPSTLEGALELVEIASSLAPQESRVQAQLGELLLRMGRLEEALGYLSRAVVLDETLAENVVQLGGAYGLTAAALHDALPRGARTLAALGQAYSPDGFAEYVRLVETAIDEGNVTPTRRLLSAYGAACVEIDQTAHLEQRLSEMSPIEDSEAEAERLIQLGRSALLLGRPHEAVDWAAQGLELHPEAYYYAGFLGDAAMAADQPERAIEAYRHGLSVLARGKGQPAPRAHLYRRIGEVYDALGQADLAYDQYRRALDLRPDEPHAKRRMDQMTQRSDTGRPRQQ